MARSPLAAVLITVALLLGSMAGIQTAQAAPLTPVSDDCQNGTGAVIEGSVGDTVQVTLAGPCSLQVSGTAGVVSWTNGASTNPLSLPSGTTVLTFSLLADGMVTVETTDQFMQLQFRVSDLGTFSCSTASNRSETFVGAIGDTVSFIANGSCTLSSSVPAVATWTAGGATNPTTAVNALVTLTLASPGTTQFAAAWPFYPASGGRLDIAITTTGTVPSLAETPIPVWHQAVGRSGESATCDPGWSPSWQAWAVPVTGGWVCQREIPSLGTSIAR